MIVLFTDFGAADLYVGQVKAALHRRAPGVPVVDLMHDAPAFNVKAGAHLLAALAGQVPEGSVTMAVVDPGVGGARRALALRADGRWYVGPDNGLLSVLAARSRRVEAWTIGWRPPALSASFHGRDLFAPVAALLALDRPSGAVLEPAGPLEIDFGGGDLPEVIYVDHYGNAMTGLRAAALGEGTKLVAGGQRIGRARVFVDVPPGALFWYENSIGLAEIAENGGSAARRLDLAIGVPVAPAGH